jgi:hypothetical protein
MLCFANRIPKPGVKTVKVATGLTTTIVNQIPATCKLKGMSLCGFKKL